MKAYKTVLFIFCVMAGLAAVCRFFPEEGIRVGNVCLEFPSLEQVLQDGVVTAVEDTVPADPQLTPEQLMQQRLEALQLAKEKEFMEYCTQAPARFYLPGDSISYLDAFFDALEDADKRHVRIMHYGDSQLECDRISGCLRQEFQERFGGSGVGLVPAVQTVPTYTLGQTASPEGLPRYLAYGPANMRAGHGRYGVMAQMARVDGNASFTFRTRGGKDYSHSRTFSEVTVLAQGTGSLKVSAADSAFVLDEETATEGLEAYTVRLPRAVDRASLSVNGHWDVYGIMLDGSKGVSVDNIPMRGASGTMFTRISRQSMEPFFRKENVGLIILQYGGNSVPYLKSDKAIETYKEGLKKQIALFRSLSPRSRILFIGPADMATSIQGKMQTYPYLEKVVQAIREAALESGVAFWNLYESMGGKGSVVEWVNARPQLAGSDYVHFTPKGAQQVAHILFETFELYHKFYRFRTGKDKVTLPEDSLMTADSLGLQPDSLAMHP